LALVGAAFIWGATFVVVKHALESSSTLLFLALRFTLGAAVLAVLARRQWTSLPNKPLAWRAGLLTGGALFFGYLFQTLGLRLTTPAKSGFITAFSVVLVPIVGAALFRLRVSWNAWLGVILAAAGLYLLLAPSGIGQWNRGDLLTLLCAVAFAFHVPLVGRYTASVGAGVLTTLQVGLVALVSMACWWWAEPAWLHWNGPYAAAVVVTALFPTALCFSIQSWAQQYTSPTQTALILTLEPVFAWLTSYLVLGEVLGTGGFAGAALILGGIVLSEMKPGEPAAASHQMER